MATPKRRSSNRRSNLRRSHHHVAVPAYTRDPKTGEISLRHRVTPSGVYRGKQVVTVEVKSKEKPSEK